MLRNHLFPLIAGGAFAIGSAAAVAQQNGADNLRAAETKFRVCAVPNNLPYTNEGGGGFDNKIAELLAREEGKSLEYTWWPAGRGLVRNTLRSWKCDMIMGVPAGYELTATTKPYYCSTYVAVRRNNSNKHFDWKSLSGAKKVGVMMHTPPLDMLLEHQINPKVYLPPVDHRSGSPGEIVGDVASGATDAALTWGPVGGYFAKLYSSPTLRVEHLDQAFATTRRIVFPIAIGVRHGDHARLARLNGLLVQHKDEIDKILEAFGVPLVEDSQQCRGPQKQAEAKSTADQAANQSSKARLELVVSQSSAAAETGQAGASCDGMPTREDIGKIEAGTSEGAKPYTLKDGKVGEKTYVGWTRFAAFCERCHGPGGVGSALAPDLTAAIPALNKTQFDKILTCGLKGNIGTGVMPAWGNNPNIAPYIDNLWAYLKARSEGGLPAGRPEKIEKDAASSR